VCVVLPGTLRVRLPRGLLRWQRPRAVGLLPRAKIGARMAGLLNTNGRAAAHEFVIPLESSPLAFQALPDFRKTVENVRQVNPERTLRGIFQGRHVPIVEDEQAERYSLRALLEVWEHRAEEAGNGAREIERALDRRRERGMTRLLRAGLGLLVVPLVVAGYAGLTGLILPLVALRSVFPRRGRRQRLVHLQALAAERLLPARS